MLHFSHAQLTRRRFLQSSAAVGILASHRWPLAGAEDAPRAGYRLMPLPLKDVDITDEFWLPRIDKARTVSLPVQLDYALQSEKRLSDGRLIEAAAYFLTKKPDPELEQKVQTLLPRLTQSVMAQRGIWKNVDDGPFFWTGHFFEAAVAYHQATGSEGLLNSATALADDLADQYGPGKRTDISNHEGIELALVKLYRETGNPKYLRLGQFILDVRGTTAGGRTLTGPYAQDHEPVKDQKRAIGHCVRGTYLYCALTDLAAFDLDPAYRPAAHRIWEDAVSKRTYLTGGIGSYRREENFGDDYDLPNLSCWNEICAAVGNSLWNQRMFQLTGDGQYCDMLERILYNGMLAGVSLDGAKFLYQTPLKTLPAFQREARFGPNCCPPNITRLLAQFGTLIYARDERQLYVNLFVGSRARFTMDGKPIALVQETKYPWAGKVTIRLAAPSPTRFALNVRVPSWVGGDPMPGSLYRSEGHSGSDAEIFVNGKKASSQVIAGFAHIDREWSDDIIEVSLPMNVRLVRANERVQENAGRVAMECGPLVFCAEGIDNSGKVFNLVVPQTAHLEFSHRPDLLGGVGTIHGTVQRFERSSANRVEFKEARLVAIPYSTFGNREGTEMAVWLAGDSERAIVRPTATLASSSVATSSCGNGSVADNYPGHNPPTVAKRMYPLSQDGSGEISAIYDQIVPIDSEDGSGTFLRLRPQEGKQVWVQYDFPKPSRVSSVSVYWKDDKQFCVAPESWKLMYKAGDQWVPVTGADSFSMKTDTYNTTRFSPVETSALRLEIALQGRTYKKGQLGPPDANYLREDLTWYEGGIIEWKVNA
jgi:uncharacterized protein